MTKHLTFLVALTAVVGWGCPARAAAPLAESKAPPPDSNVSTRVAGTALDAASLTSPGAAVPSRANPELNASNRSPADDAAQRDTAFSKYVDLALLAQATAGPDASLLTDVAFGLAEGERILVRKHRSGLTADSLMARAVKLAARLGDKATQERIGRAAAARNKPQWAKLIAEEKEFGAVTRDGPMVAVNKIDGRSVALIESVRQACAVASLTGQKAPLADWTTEVAESPAEAPVKVYLSDMIAGCLKSLPEKPDETGNLLEEFSATSRFGNPFNNTPFDPRTWPGAVEEVGNRASNTVQVIQGQGYHRFYVRNRHQRPVWVAVLCQKNNGFGNYWATLGWWKLAPYERAYLENTKNRNIYVYAHDDQGVRWGGSTTALVWNQRMPNVNGINMDINPRNGAYHVGFLHVDMGSAFCDHTLNLNR